MHRLLIPFLLVLLSLARPAAAQSAASPNPWSEFEDDAITVSLLTAAPGHDVYRLYGHTAVRIREGQHTDITANYGVFSFQTPNFVMKFVLGLTDYSVAQESTALFLSEYMSDDMPITEQVLDLTPSEAKAVQQALNEVFTTHGEHRRIYPVEALGGGTDTLVLRTTDWTYRYNFLYDNCTTRAVQAIVRAIEAGGSRVIYPKQTKLSGTLSQREMIHEFTRQSPWYEFGQDLLLGPEVDERHALRDMPRINFLPTYAEAYFEEAEIVAPDGTRRPLVRRSAPLFPLTPRAKQPAFPLSPTMVFWLLTAAAAALSVGAWRNREKAPTVRRAWRIWTLSFDTLLLLGMGSAGTLIALMVGWSAHPAVDRNWLLTIFHPLLLVYLPYHLWTARTCRRDFIAPVIGVGAISYFAVKLLGWQVFPNGADALALTLLLRSIFIYFSSVFEAKRRQQPLSE